MRNLKARMIKLGKNDRIALEAFEEALEAKQRHLRVNRNVAYIWMSGDPFLIGDILATIKNLKILPLPVQEVTL